MKKRIKYCALTTIDNSMTAFVLPAMKVFKDHGYDITLVCKMSKEFQVQHEKEFSCFPIDIERGYNLIKTIKNIVVLFSYFRKEKFDMIQYGTENVSLCAAIAGFFAGIPVRIYDHWGARYIGLSGFSRFICKNIERIAAFFSTDIRQVSNLNMEQCIKDKIYSSKKVKVLGMGGTIGVDTQVFDLEKKEQYRTEIREEYDIPQNSVLIGYVGTIRKDKGSNELIEAFRKLSHQKENIYLMLVGGFFQEDPISYENQQWAEASNHVIFTGRVSDVHRYMSAMDILVHPSYREGFGMVLQEAAALRIPIITTNIPGPSEFIKDGQNGILIEKEDAESLLKAIEFYLDNSNKMKVYAENAYTLVKEYFSREIMIHRMLKDRTSLYEKRIEFK